MKGHVAASPRQAAGVPPIAAARSHVLQRKCACGGSPGPSGECEACRKKRLQRKCGHAAEPMGVPSIVYDVLRSPGQPLDSGTRAFFEPRFGHDFSQVRVHTDARAAESARSVNALAYTVGRDVVFGREGYRPGSESGRRLVGHELTHVVQQRYATGSLQALSVDGGQADPLEQEAQRVSDLVSHGRRLDHSRYCRIGAASEAAKSDGRGRWWVRRVFRRRSKEGREYRARSHSARVRAHVSRHG